MAANKIVPGPRDHAYGTGPHIPSNNIRPSKLKAKNLKKSFKEGYG